VSLLEVGRSRIASVAIDAAEPDGFGLEMRIVLSLMARDAAGAFRLGRFGRLSR
jgi:hypothetical protein